MNPLRFSPFVPVAGLLALLTTGALAHPEPVADDAISANPPVFFLVQTGAPAPAPAAPAAAAKAANVVSITTEGDFRVIKSNGWPDHAPGTFPRRGNPNVVAPQNYTFRVPLKPVAAATPERRGGWWWGVAINGVPFEPGTAEAWNNDRRSGWSYEAGTGFLNLGLDENNAHVQPNGSYHYHALPTGLVERLGGEGKKMLLIGWAADGFPIYSGMAFTDPKDPKSPLKKMVSSYHLKPGARPVQEGGPGGNYDGRFTQDFEYKAGTGDLDECNGRTGVTPEFPQGTYYYCISAEFPFVPRMWHGVPDTSFNKGDRPPGGGGQREAPIGGAPRGILEGGPGAPATTAAPGGGGGTQRGMPAIPVLEALDLNHDGVLDADELAKAPASLKALDKNGDGKLTPDEYRPANAGVGRQPNAAPVPAPAAPAEVKPAAAPAPTPAATSGTAQPNILLLVVDDLGWGDVGFHGGTVPTPAIERLTKEGMELQRFYVYPVCSPTRAALISGQMPRRFGVTAVMGPGQTLPVGMTTLPGTLRSAGYTTSLIGKWHLGKGASIPSNYGFDHFYGFLGPQIDYFQHTDQRGNLDWQRDGTTLQETGYSTTLIADEAIRQIGQRDPKKPFFIEVTFNAPHVPQSAPEEIVKKYASLGDRATGAAVIDAMDAGIGRVLDALDQQHLRDNTLVVFFSDNGATRRLGSNGVLRAGKDTPYEGGIHTPAAIRWPGHIPAGHPTLMPVSVQDLFPTLTAAAGVKNEAKLDGANVWPALHEGHVESRPPFAIATADIALIDGDWKLIEWSTGERALYNLAKDLSETTDQLAAQPDIAKRLIDRLTDLKKDLPAATAVSARPGPGGPPGRGAPIR